MKFLCLLLTVMACHAAPPWVWMSEPLASSGGGFATNFVTDTFVRADSNPMSTSASDGTSTWFAKAGNATACQISVNRLEGTGGTSICGIASPTLGNNQSASITIGTGGSANSMGVMVRVQGSGNCAGYLLFADSTTQLSFYKISSTPSATQIGTSMTVSTMSAGSVIKLDVTGSTLTAYLNGVSQGTVTDTTYASGTVGVYFSAASVFVTPFSANDHP